MQAIQFDVDQAYKSRLEVSLHRIQLRSQLYTKPDRSEDAAAMIIEQVT